MIKCPERSDLRKQQDRTVHIGQASDLRFFPIRVPLDIRVLLSSLSPLTCENAFSGTCAKTAKGSSKMPRCAAEMCLNWTGDGCVCAVFDLEPVVAEEPRFEVFVDGADEPEVTG